MCDTQLTIWVFCSGIHLARWENTQKKENEKKRKATSGNIMIQRAALLWLEVCVRTKENQEQEVVGAEVGN